MRHWSQLATRNWRTRPGRTLGAVAAIALGTAAVVWVTCCYESIRQTVLGWATGYIGNSHVLVSSPLGKYDQIPQSLVDSVAAIANVDVVCPTLIQRVRCVPWPAAKGDTERPTEWNEQTEEIDLFGVDLKTEFEIRDHQTALVEGRFVEASDDMACVLERAFAIETGLKLGDSLLVVRDPGVPPHELQIVGLYERKRIARFQKPVAMLQLHVLQRMRSKVALITTLDIRLADSSISAVRRTAELIRAKVRGRAQKATIRSAEARIRQIELAQDQQSFVLILLSCVAMLTALFIILSTLSMGMIERIGQLGLMRCVGMTRGQLAALVVVEVLPLGVLGVGLGIPIGIALAQLTVWIVPDYVGTLAISVNGLLLAAGAGILTSLLAGAIPALAALRVSPLEATRPLARTISPGWLVAVGVLALGVLAVQHFLVLEKVQRSVWFVQMGATSVVLLYVAYALAAPVLVGIVGSIAVYFAAAALRLRVRLLQDQVGHAVWRSAGICCGLMVGLSLIVGILVVNQSVTSGWQFPKKFPEAYVWSMDQMKPGADPTSFIRSVPGIKNFTAGNAINVQVEEKQIFMAAVQISTTWFMGCDPDSFLDLMNIEFLPNQGDKETAIQLLKQGGHILVADDFSASRDKKLGDTVKIYYAGLHPLEFKVAGVIRSPAIDIAAGYFQMHSEYNVVASGSVMGSNSDLARLFGVKGTKLVLLNFDLPPEPPPADWPPPRDSAKGRLLSDRYYDATLPLERRWQRWREDQTLRGVTKALTAPQANYGTVRELKDEIDRELTKMTRLMTAVPGVALIVAALGVANLMMANVTARARQLAILRAVGATRGLIVRLVIAEAIVLGLLGTGLGLGLGIHLASNITTLVESMWGYRVSLTLPWPIVGGAAVLTVALCILAGIPPARRAARNNIVDALHVA
jgi:putative ABC transport system permease protein